RDPNADTLDWSDLRERSRSGTDAEKREAIRILNRRTALASAPLLFAFLAGALGLRIRRGGRSTGIILSLVAVVVYYLISLLGESLARVGSVSPYVGPWLATVVTLAVTVFLLMKSRVSSFSLGRLIFKRRQQAEHATSVHAKQHQYNLGIDSLGLPNLMDATLLRT